MSAEVVEKLLAARVLPGAQKGYVSPVKLDTTALPGGSIVMLLFVNDEPEPSYVVRMPRTPGQPGRIVTNFKALRALSQVRPVAESVPRPVFCGPVDGLMTSVETCVPGLPLALSLRNARNEGRREDAAHLFDLAARWLWDLHAATSTQLLPPVSQRRTIEGHVVASIRALNEEELLSDSQARELLAALSLAASPNMPVSRVHGDCNPNNMLLDRKSGVSVIDWEYSTTGWALWDLFTLVRTAWFQPTGVAEPNAVLAQEVWDSRTPMGRAFSVALRRYEIRWGIRREQCRVLFGAYIAQQLSEQLGTAPRVTPTEPWRTLLRAAVSH